jgi:hypothetical protein
MSRRWSRVRGFITWLALFLAMSGLASASLCYSEQSIIGGPYFVLDHGWKGGYGWRVFTSPMRQHSHNRSAPCMDVTVERKLRPISEAEVFSSCGAVKPFPTITEVAVGSGNAKVTVAGMAFDRGVHTAKIPLSDGRTVKRRLRVISSRAAQRAQVERFAFLAFTVARGLSIGHVTGYDASGRLVSGRRPTG